MNSNIEKIFGQFKTKYKEGFTEVEQVDLLCLFSTSLNISRYYDTLIGTTGVIIDNNKITYNHDVLVALRCTVEDRDMTQEEFDER